MVEMYTYLKWISQKNIEFSSTRDILILSDNGYVLGVRIPLKVCLSLDFGGGSW